ncbi:MAG TPA: glycosyltransferase family 4 protein [Bryobacteraceae bacterium]|nr:glycosyltransferase family 4 protein [Bryobacteraceae bacterium]
MKPLVLLVVDNGFWAIGEVGRQIVRRFRHKYDFLFLTERILSRRRDLLNQALLRTDLVLCLNESGAATVGACATVALPPLVTWIHHVTTWNEEHKIAARTSQLLLTSTPSWRDRIAAYAPGTQVAFVRHGVDLDFFAPRAVSRELHGIAPDSFVAGFFGARGSDQDAGRKGMDVLLAVFRRIATAVPNLHAVFAGPGWEPFVSELRATGAQATIFGFVPRSRLPEMYSLLDVYLVTARVEGGPLTVLESLACGTPVVSTRVGLVPDVVIDGVNGFTADVGDVETLSGALLKMASSAELRRSMQSNARPSAEKCSWTELLAPLESYLDDLIRLPPRRKDLPALPWIEDADHTCAVSLAADCMANAIADVRTKRARVWRSLLVLRHMLEGVPPADRLRALSLLRGRWPR